MPVSKVRQRPGCYVEAHLRYKRSLSLGMTTCYSAPPPSTPHPILPFFPVITLLFDALVPLTVNARINLPSLIQKSECCLACGHQMSHITHNTSHSNTIPPPLTRTFTSLNQNTPLTRCRRCGGLQLPAQRPAQQAHERPTLQRSRSCQKVRVGSYCCHCCCCCCCCSF